MARRVLLLLAVLVITVPALAAARRRAVHPPPPEQLSPIASWVRASAIPFDTTAARSGLRDLEPLRQIVGGARIVSLGEATHGTHEFFTMKHRMLEFLVEEMGFTVFAIEGNLPEADEVDDYVVNGIGDPGAALAGMYFWTWNTTEVLDMIHWMREYNLRRGDKPPVRFRGFDNQFAREAAPKVEAYVRKVDPARAGEVTALYDCFRPFESTTFNNLSSTARGTCRENAEKVHTLLASRRADYAARSSAVELENHLRYARVVNQTMDVWARRGSRDLFMAENVSWLADAAHPGEKIVLWAHNFHVSTEPGAMGRHLRQKYGSQSVIFGFAFDRGSFTAVGPGGLGTQRIESVPPGGWESLFRQPGAPRFLLDMRNVPGEVAATISYALPLWSIGAVFGTGTASDGRPATLLFQRYDVLIYVESSTPTTLRR